VYQRHDDLTPVRLSARNAYVVFDDVTVSALSPIRHLDRLHAPVIVAYGTRLPSFSARTANLPLLSKMLVIQASCDPQMW
jgi:hypothetical protein